MSSSQTNPVTDSDEAIRRLQNQVDTLQQALKEVSSVGIIMMHHTHRQDCSSYTRDFLKSIVTISQEIKLDEVKDVFKHGYELATNDTSALGA